MRELINIKNTMNYRGSTQIVYSYMYDKFKSNDDLVKNPITFYTVNNTVVLIQK